MDGHETVVFPAPESEVIPNGSDYGYMTDCLGDMWSCS